MTATTTNSYYRLIALWVVCEAFIGGIIHGLHIPVSGLIVGSAAITCIALIGWYHPKPGAIIRATIVVMIFKMLLSPQAPITAYVAVLFQGLMGQLLFRNRKYFGTSVILFAVIALLESAFQRFLILTIVYGTDVWSAINFMLNKLTGQQEWTNYSKWLIAGYTGIHLITGLLLGYGLSRLPNRIEKWKKDLSLLRVISRKEISVPGNRIIWGLWAGWIILLLLLLQSEWGPGASILPVNTIITMLIRSVVIIAGWVLLIGPIMKWLLHHWLTKQQGKLKQETEAVMNLLPETNQLLREAWTIASRREGLIKYGKAIRYILVNALEDEHVGHVYILSAAKGSGKTYSLMKWSEKRKDVHGILSPVIDGKRMFLDIDSRELFPMEALPGEKETLQVGKYIFSRKSFDRAIAILEEARHKPGWLIIDEAGPLELRGEGLHEVLLRSLKRNGNSLIVVRDGLEKDFFSLLGPSVRVIRSADELLNFM